MGVLSRDSIRIIMRKTCGDMHRLHGSDGEPNAKEYSKSCRAYYSGSTVYALVSRAIYRGDECAEVGVGPGIYSWFIEVEFKG